MNSKNQRIAWLTAIVLTFVVGLGFLVGGLVPLLGGLPAASGAAILSQTSHVAYAVTGGAAVLVALLMLAVLVHNQRQRRLLEV